MEDPKLGPSKSQVNGAIGQGMKAKVLRSAQKRANRALARLIIALVILVGLATGTIYMALAANSEGVRILVNVIGGVLQIASLVFVLASVSKLIKAHREIKRYEEQR